VNGGEARVHALPIVRLFVRQALSQPSLSLNVSPQPAAAATGAPLVASLAYFGAHAPPGTDASAKFADASCSWNQAALSGNLLLLLTCLHPRFSSRDTAVQKGPSTTGLSSGCSGPLIDDWFDKHRQGRELDLGGAQQLAESVGKRLRKRDECSGEWSHPLHVCFRHASTKAALDRTEMSKFVGCLLGDEDDAVP